MADVRTHEPDAHDSVYAGLLGSDAHWAFGTDFEDPLAGVDTTVPAGVEPAALAAYCLMLGDDALVLSHRISEWCSRAPDLEEDIALANIALDLLGQARLLLARAAAADPGIVPALPEGSPVPDEDRLAFFREDDRFRNVRLDRAGWEVADLDAVELNEAFASQAVACIRELGLDDRIVNADGGAIALGHPLGCSGTRIVVTLLNRMEREGGRRGLATMCVGVGQGPALLLERV